MKIVSISALAIIMLVCSVCCRENRKVDSPVAADNLNLKRGDIISCGTGQNEFGTLSFEITGNEKAKELFTLGLKLMHSFEYDEAEKAFAKVIDEEPECPMAYWGVAMSNFHPLWSPPTETEMIKGARAVSVAEQLRNKTDKETDYIKTIAAFYTNWQTTDHRTRCLAFEQAMEKLHQKYPRDKEAAIFYALSLTAAADPGDKTFAKQKKAGAILNALYPAQPNHPGIVHYLIHTYDSPELATLGLDAARKYASVAPSSAHALHMPSHIFTRLGLWEECIQSNLGSVDAAQCYAKSAGIKGHWDEELHGLDYLVYAYLQKGDNLHAKQYMDYLQNMKDVQPVNFKVAYAVAAIPARYTLENKMWAAAANLKVHEEKLIPGEFLWQKSIIYLARLLGAVQLNDVKSASAELEKLESAHARLLETKDGYKAGKLEISIKTGQAWIALGKGKKDDALLLMHEAADLEDQTEKSPVSPGEIIPARELLGDMYSSLNMPEKALEAYEGDLKKQPNRFNGLVGAALSAEKIGNTEKASFYYRQLLAIADKNCNRPEITKAKAFLNNTTDTRKKL